MLVKSSRVTPREERLGLSRLAVCGYFSRFVSNFRDNFLGLFEESQLTLSRLNYY
ncbi:hypothetical protein WH47_03009 [Habropoda laboriosa]|uniref:Uncharacterized protein n=1 Tax=Habropoda laboriosa TaxID=597456 RepID=A0A0L7QSY5_9HYME|nr:hypothetical protein WH47_03009 [Habropoda laboriosa]